MGSLSPRVPLVLQFAIYAAYAGRLETAFLTDEVASANAVLHSPALTPAPPTSPLSTVPQAEAPAALQQPQKVSHLTQLHLSVPSAPKPLVGAGQMHVHCRLTDP